MNPIRHFFGRYRPLLFELVRSLELQSTSQDRSLPVALEFVLKHEQRRSMILRSRNYELNVCFPQMKQPSDIGNSPNISIVMQKSEHRLVGESGKSIALFLAIFLSQRQAICLSLS